MTVGCRGVAVARRARGGIVRHDVNTNRSSRRRFASLGGELREPAEPSHRRIARAVFDQIRLPGRRIRERRADDDGQVGTDLRLQMLRAVLRSKWEYFLHQPVGKLTNALATEAQRSSAAFVNGATAITFLIQALVYGAVAFAISWRASLAAIGAGVVVIGLSHFLVRLTRKAGKRQTRLMSSLMANLTDTLQSVKPLKAMSREHLADQVLAHDTNQLNRALRRQVLYGAVLDSAQELMFTGFICLGVWVAIEKFNIDLAMVMVLVVALGRAFSFFGKVQKQHQKLAQGESAYWSLMASIDAAAQAEEHVDGGVEPHFEQGLQ